DDLFDAWVGHQRLEDAQAEDGVEQAPSHSVGVDQQRRIGGDCAPLVSGDLFIDDGANALLLLAAGRKQPPVTHRTADGFGHAVGDQPLSGAITRMEWRVRGLRDGYPPRLREPATAAVWGRSIRASGRVTIGVRW